MVLSFDCIATIWKPIWLLVTFGKRSDMFFLLEGKWSDNLRGTFGSTCLSMIMKVIGIRSEVLVLLWSWKWSGNVRKCLFVGDLNTTWSGKETFGSVLSSMIGWCSGNVRTYPLDYHRSQQNLHFFSLLENQWAIINKDFRKSSKKVRNVLGNLKNSQWYIERFCPFRSSDQ